MPSLKPLTKTTFGSSHRPLFEFLHADSLLVDEKLLEKKLKLGSFQFSWQQAAAGVSLQVVSFVDDNFLWLTPAGRSFFRTGLYHYWVNERHSSFKISHVTQSLKIQTVERFEFLENRVILSGNIQTFDEGCHPYRLEFEAQEDNGLSFDFKVAPFNGFVEFVLCLQKQAPLQGLGEQFTFLDARGHRVPLMTQEGGVGRGRWPISALIHLLAPGAQGHPFSSYCPMPLCHHDGWTLYIENTQYQEFDLTDAAELKVLVFSNQMSGKLYVHKNPLVRIRQVTKQTGRMQPPPQWLDKGAVVAVQGGSEVLLSKMQRFSQAGVQVSAYWIQDWVGRRVTSFGDQLWWNYELDDQRYPELRQIKAKLSAEGIQLLGYINPMVVDVSQKPSYQRNLYQEGSENRFFVQNDQGEPYPVHITDFYGYMVDLTNPQARQWYKEIIRNNLIAKQSGMRLFDGAMADFGEGLPLDAKLFDGTDALSYHNQYPVEWARLVQEVCQEEGTGELYFFLRAGFSKTCAYAHSLWCGDQNHTYDRYDGLHSALIAMLNAGMCGISSLHSDIGGYTTVAFKGFGLVRRRRLLQAWIEMAAFTSVFRTHEGSKPAWNCQVDSDEQVLSLFARFSKIYQALGFYRRQLYTQACEHGWPLVRQMGLHYSKDENCVHCDSQFLLGTEFLVAPVLKPLHRYLGRRVYLPKDNWVHLWTGKRYALADEGPRTITVKAPLGFPPVFYKEGSQVAKEFIDHLEAAGVQLRFP